MVLINILNIHISLAMELAQADIFYSIYFAATGVHMLHVFIGMAVLGVILKRTYEGRYSKEKFTAIEIGGLYWHLVDLIWIYLFPLLYLVG